MPIGSTIIQGNMLAAQRVASLAAQNPSTGAVLAASTNGTLYGSRTPTLQSFKQTDATHKALTQAVEQSCSVGSGDARACSAAAQRLGSYEALVSSPYGALTQSILRKRDDSSINVWFMHRNQVLPPRSTTADVGALAVTLSAITP